MLVLKRVLSRRKRSLAANAALDAVGCPWFRGSLLAQALLAAYWDLRSFPIEMLPSLLWCVVSCSSSPVGLVISPCWPSWGSCWTISSVRPGPKDYPRAAWPSHISTASSNWGLSTSLLRVQPLHSSRLLMKILNKYWSHYWVYYWTWINHLIHSFHSSAIWQLRIQHFPVFWMLVAIICFVRWILWIDFTPLLQNIATCSNWDWEILLIAWL